MVDEGQVTEAAGPAAPQADLAAAPQVDPKGAYRKKRRMVGIVSGTKMQKTVAVEVRMTTVHRRYKKYLSRRKKYLVHDEHSVCGLGDKVLIVETRPISKLKSFRIDKVLEKAKG